MGVTKIEWVKNLDGSRGVVWNPVTGCSKVSDGCRHCYAESLARRFRKDFKPWTAPNAVHNVRFHPERLEQPLHWTKPRRVFVNSVSDLFHERVPDGFIDQAFAVMALTTRHTFQVLTKRAKRMQDYISGLGKSFARLKAACPVGWSMEFEGIPLVSWPLPNVHLGVSAEDQATFDERVAELLQTPTAVRFVSLEPLLGPIDVSKQLWPVCWHWDSHYRTPEDALAAGAYAEQKPQGLVSANRRFINWVIVGGESGPGARPMHLNWVRSILNQRQSASVPCFVKQLGAFPCDEKEVGTAKGGSPIPLKLKDSKGGDPNEWPEDLRIREMPNAIPGGEDT